MNSVMMGTSSQMMVVPSLAKSNNSHSVAMVSVTTVKSVMMAIHATTMDVPISASTRGDTVEIAPSKLLFENNVMTETQRTEMVVPERVPSNPLLDVETASSIRRLSNVTMAQSTPILLLLVAPTVSHHVVGTSSSISTKPVMMAIRKMEMDAQLSVSSNVQQHQNPTQLFLPLNPIFAYTELQKLKSRKFHLLPISQQVLASSSSSSLEQRQGSVLRGGFYSKIH